jgi:Sec-independent protein translocase protein TatA
MGFGVLFMIVLGLVVLGPKRLHTLCETLRGQGLIFRRRAAASRLNLRPNLGCSSELNSRINK